MTAAFFIFLLLPTYLIRFNVAGVPSTLLEVVIWVAFAYTAYQNKWWVRKNWPKLDRGTAAGAGVLLLASLIALAGSPDLRAGLGLFKGFIFDPLLVLLILRGSDFGEWPELPWWGYGLSALVMAGWGLVQWAAAHDLSYRGHGPYESANYLAFYLVPATMFFVYETIQREWPRKLLSAAETLILAFAVVVTASRGGLLGLAAGAIVWGGYFFYQKKGQGRALAAAGLIIAVGLAVFALTGHKERVITSDKTREVIWQHSVTVIEHHPLTGAGLGGFHQVFKATFPGGAYPAAPQVPDVATAHDVYLTFWLNIGILGLGAFLWLCGVGLRQAWARRDDPLAWLAVAALAGMLVHGVVDASVWKNDLFPLFWLAVSTSFLFKANRKPNPLRAR